MIKSPDVNYDSVLNTVRPYNLTAKEYIDYRNAKEGKLSAMFVVGGNNHYTEDTRDEKNAIQIQKALNQDINNDLMNLGLEGNI